MHGKRNNKDAGFGILGAAMLLALSPIVPVAIGQTAPVPVITLGEVTANEVYVRSGPSENHYPLCKVDAGARVKVVGERGDWMEVLPVEGTFSYVSGDYVDSADGKTGVVNGDNVRIRAGSALADFASLKYVVQTKLAKGAAVTILGREPDGFLRIVPPPAVTQWISRQYIAFVPASASKSAAKGPSVRSGDGKAEQLGGDSMLATSEGNRDGDHPAVESRPGEQGSPGAASAGAFAGMPITPFRKQLLELDVEARRELAKPALERSFSASLERYRLIAAQEEDEVARRYAAARIEQLEDMQSIADAVQQLHRIGDETETKRRSFLEGRATMREPLPAMPAGVDAQGELRVSALFDSMAGMQRYRLVDPSGAADRTIGYVEIPPDSSIDAKAFLGRFVGVRASSRRLQAGGVDPVPIFVARELVLMQSGGEEKAREAGDADEN